MYCQIVAASHVHQSTNLRLMVKELGSYVHLYFSGSCSNCLPYVELLVLPYSHWINCWPVEDRWRKDQPAKNFLLQRLSRHSFKKLRHHPLVSQAGTGVELSAREHSLRKFFLGSNHLQKDPKMID